MIALKINEKPDFTNLLLSFELRNKLLFSYSGKQSSWFLSLTYSTRTMGKTTITLFLVEKTRFTPPNIPLPAAFCSVFICLSSGDQKHNASWATSTSFFFWLGVHLHIYQGNMIFSLLNMILSLFLLIKFFMGVNNNKVKSVVG